MRLNEEKPRSATIDLIAYKLPSTLVRARKPRQTRRPGRLSRRLGPFWALEAIPDIGLFYSLNS